MTLLAVRGLRKSYDAREVVAGVDFELTPGECFGLLGPNGAGKTTTLRLVLGLTQANAGHITLLDHDVATHAREARARVGVVPQLDNLDPDFTVRENLQVYGRYFGMTPAAVEQRIPELLDYAELTARANARIQSLSGGMKRRLTLARALINDPDLLFLDEPTTGLDPQARHVIWERLRQLMLRGKTLLLTTHFMDEAERLCHRLAIMDHGRIIATGTPRELIGAHIEPEVVEVYGDGAQAWAARSGNQLALRCERHGETVFCYARDAQALLADLAHHDAHADIRYLHRRANLEDVFLKLTGRELRD
jgi:lipooligosaccharide transport system ATP-binding protein